MLEVRAPGLSVVVLVCSGAMRCFMCIRVWRMPPEEGADGPTLQKKGTVRGVKRFVIQSPRSERNRRRGERALDSVATDASVTGERRCQNGNEGHRLLHSVCCCCFVSGKGKGLMDHNKSSRSSGQMSPAAAASGRGTDDGPGSAFSLLASCCAISKASGASDGASRDPRAPDKGGLALI